MVPPRDAAELAEAIGRLVSDRRLRRAFGREGRRMVEEELDEPLVVERVLRELYRLPTREGQTGSAGVWKNG